MWVLANQESWKIPKGWSEAINRKIKNDTKDKRKVQIMICKTLNGTRLKANVNSGYQEA